MPIYGTNGNDNLRGTASDDIFFSSRGIDFLDGRGGDDTVSYADWSGPVTVSLGLNGGNGFAYKYVVQWIIGRPYTWYNSTDTLRSIENVIGSRYGDTITGNELDNILTGLGGGDTLNGGDGTDTVDYSASDGRVMANLSAGFGEWGHAEGDRYTSIENVIGSKYDDMLLGNWDANKLQGMGDDDDLNGVEGADVLDGGDGSDTALYNFSPEGVRIDLRVSEQTSAGHGNGDVLISIENVLGSDHFDILTGNGESNRLRGGDSGDWLAGLGGPDQLEGGDGEDMADYRDSPAPVVVHLNGNFGLGGDAEGDTFDSIENVNGSYYDDTLTGDTRDNRLEGFDGDDVLAGGYGADRLHGGEDIDTADYSLSASLEAGWWDALLGVTVNLSTGEAYGDDAEGDSFLSIENVIGSRYLDTLTGDDEANVLEGGDGSDALEGLGGADTLIGGDDTGEDSASYGASPEGVTVNLATNLNRHGHAEGDKLYGIESVYGSKYNDEIFGNADDNLLHGSDGADELYGGLGRDELNGGSNDGAADIFYYTSVEESVYAINEELYDTIFAFESGRDRLDLRKMDADVRADGDQAFTVVDAFTGRGAELIVTDTEDAGDGDETAMVLGDVDADAQADFAIRFYGDVPQGVGALITQFDILL